MTRFARTVTLIHRRDGLRASKIMQERALSNPKMRFAWNSAVEDVLGDAKVSGLVLRDTVTDVTREIAVTGLFVAIGHDPRSELLPGQVAWTMRGMCSLMRRQPVPPHLGFSPAVTSWITPTAKPSRPPAPVAQQRWTPSDI